MLHEPVHQQLARLGLRGAADALVRLPLHDDVLDPLAVLLQAEGLRRDSLGQARRLKLARLSQSAPWPMSTCVARAAWAIPASSRLLSFNWFKRHQHLLLVGPTGIGKSYLGCALAEALIDRKKSVRYLRLPRLREEMARLQAHVRIGQWLKTLGRIYLLILDDFGLAQMSPSHQPLPLEQLEDRHRRGSVLVTSQLPIKLWHGQFQDPTLADAILDRLVHKAQITELTGDSMRKKNPPTTLTEDDKPSPKI